jgi:hypothetical protein
MNMTKRMPLTGAEAWRGADIAKSNAWLHPLSEAAIAEIDAALAQVKGSGLSWSALSRESFPLGAFGAELAAMASDLEQGCGLVKLTGLPVSRYSEEELRAVFFGLGAHLGTPVGQNGQRGLMRDIRDNSKNGGTRVDSAGALRWHNDRADVVGLLCVKSAHRGGVSRIVSAPAIHNAMLTRRPDLVDTLFGGFHRYSPGDEVGAEAGSYVLPVFGLREGYFTSHFSQTYIEQAQTLPGVPELTERQLEAVDMLMDLAEELSFEMPLAPGDIQFLNNHVIYHGRTAFEDDAAQGEDRLLFRLWLSMPNSRPLPESHKVLWGAVDAGALRGGA